MKRLFYKSILLSLLLAWTSMGSYAQSWDFTSIPTSDEENLKSDIENWKYDSAKKRYSYNQVITDGELMANKQVLTMMQGLHFTVKTADKIRIDAGKELQLNGKDVVLTIVGLKAGQQVTIVYASASKKEPRTLSTSNLSDIKGFEKVNGANKHTGTGTVTANGSVTFTTTDGGINIYSLKLTGSSSDNKKEEPGGTLSADHSVAFSTTQNQAIITTNKGETKYYNTQELSDISIDDDNEKVTVNSPSFSDVYTHLVTNIVFSKAAEQGKGGEILDKGVTITEAKGWLESAYAKWKPVNGDHAKGDGAIDVKSNSRFITIDHCHFWDTGKSSMCGMKNETGPNYITYHHNWFDHSDSRHARIRTMSVHLWNNFYDGCAKYGIGATMGASVFSERNYFRATKDPILISKQGTDRKGTGTFSGEAGGMIKECGSIFTEQGAGSNYTPITYAADNKSFDFYQVATREEQVPSSVKSLEGGNTYNNFDTNASLMYSYTPDATVDVPSQVTGYYGAGRLNHGSLQFKFNNAIEDSNYAPIPALESLLDNYTGE